MKATENKKRGPVHTYWLYSVGGGQLGPFTRSEARAVVAQSPTTCFRARRDGEVKWVDAAVRLAPKKRTMGIGWIMVTAILAISLLSVWWSVHRSHRTSRENRAGPQLIESQALGTSNPIAEGSPNVKSAGTESRPIASLPR